MYKLINLSILVLNFNKIKIKFKLNPIKYLNIKLKDPRYSEN